MNLLHRRVCGSNRWAAHVRDDVIPWTLEGVDLGAAALELGPGPGRTTEVLLGRVEHLTALEIDGSAVTALKSRLPDPRLNVVEGDATAMPFPDESFSGAVCLTMLHHVPSPSAQDRLFAETFRVLQRGATFAGSDGLGTIAFRLIHLFDTLVPIDPATLGARLKAAGFIDVDVDTLRSRLRFSARRPA